MVTRARDHMEEIEEDDENEEEMEQLLVCLDMLRGSSALLRQHKAGLAGLLPSRGWKARRALERLVADLTDVLSSTPSATAGSQQQPRSQQQQQGGTGGKDEVAGRGGGRVEASGVKRARGGQAAQVCSTEGPPAQQQEEEEEEEQQQQQQQQRTASPSLPSGLPADPLGLAEVVEHVMSFAEGREVLARLSRVCRLWRRVSEGERLCLPVVEQYMPCALLGGEESLHARLGGSARRCLQVHNASMTSGRLMCHAPMLPLGDLRMTTELRYGGKLLSVRHGTVYYEINDDRLRLSLDNHDEHEVSFSAASLGVDSIHDVFHSGRLEARFSVMDLTTRVVASLWWGPVMYEGDPEELDICVFGYTAAALPVTSMSYAGLPLKAEVSVFIQLDEELEDDEDWDLIPHLPERQWRISGSPCLALMGQPAIYGERFIRTRLAEEAMAAKQQGSASVKRMCGEDTRKCEV